MNKIKNLKLNRIVMVWTNDKNAKVNHMLGTPEDFILKNYTSEKRV